MGSRWETSAPVRYPDPDVVVLDRRFQRLLVPITAIERIASAVSYTHLTLPTIYSV